MKLMEICGIDMKEAYELYVDSGYNFEVPHSPPRLQSISSSILPQSSPTLTHSTLHSLLLLFPT
jgi:hypothetical protein